MNQVPRFRKGELASLLAWFEQRAIVLNMRVKRVPLHELDGGGWRLNHDDSGRLVDIESTRGFGKIVGIQVYGGDRETPDWVQVDWAEDRGGPVLLVHDESDPSQPVLLRVLAQPGHDGLRVSSGEGVRNSRACLGPSANFSWANYESFANRQPFGEQIADYDLVPDIDPATQVQRKAKDGTPLMKSVNVRLKPGFSFQIGSADGARVDGSLAEDAGKSNFYLDWDAPPAAIDPLVAKMNNRDDYAWLDRDLVREVLRTHHVPNRVGLVNEHLRAALTCLV